MKEQIEQIRVSAKEEIAKVEDLKQLVDLKVKYLGKLKSIGGYAFFDNSEVEDLSSLESIGEDAIFVCTKIKKLDNMIKYILNALDNISYDDKENIIKILKIKLIKIWVEKHKLVLL